MFFSSYRQAVREKRKAIADCILLQAKLDKAEAEIERLITKLEKRSDFFIEREFRIFDRFFTAERKTYAITDEIKHKEEAEKYDREANEAAREAFLQDKLDFLERCAREACEAGALDSEDWKGIAAKTFAENQSQYILEFEQRA